MIHQEFNWETKDKLNIYAQSWGPESNCEGVIALVHGFFEHSGRYSHVAEYFNSKNYALITFDQIGHGQSEGLRGHTPSYEHLMENIDQLIEQAKKRYEGKPIFLYGHSWGGNQALNYVLRRKPQLNGLVLTGPWIKLAVTPPKIKVALGKIMKSIYPKFSEKSTTDPNYISHDKAVVDTYINDPLNQFKITSAAYFESQDAGDFALENIKQLSIPTLLMHGGDDHFTSVEASKMLAEKNKDQIELKVWDNMYHEIHNELEKQDVFETTYNWLSKNTV